MLHSCNIILATTLKLCDFVPRHLPQQRCRLAYSTFEEALGGSLGRMQGSTSAGMCTRPVWFEQSPGRDCKGKSLRLVVHNDSQLRLPEEELN